ncbi:hypothetical protein ACFP81_11555 [Deinococcus lacus]|uniref:Uncharacterized protein n=1 Tax=Deinococcus lacus TaxID=392561 RepID=A0ABW1YEK3_9DEIO
MTAGGEVHQPLRWPEGLSDQTALPYSLWKVLDLVDGNRSAMTISTLSGYTPEQVLEALARAQQWAQRDQQLRRVVTPDVAAEVTDCLRAVMGPIANIIVEEALDELEPEPAVNTLLVRISGELSPQHLQSFAQLLQQRGLT